MKYENLNRDIRKIISIYFLKRAKIDREPPKFNNENLDRLAEANFNGR
jgi:hypothetical protein